MGYKVDEEYYCSSVDYYKDKLNSVEEQLAAFKAACDGLLSDNYYGDNVQNILIAKKDNFYNTINGKLSGLMTEVASITSDFLDKVETDDVLS